MTLHISGHVQGVFYRVETAKKADQLLLVGYVKNVSDGTVEVVAEGSKQNLDALKKWCESGSKLAKVDGIKEEWKSISKYSFKKFDIVY